jgi:hypothetical protein
VVEEISIAERMKELKREQKRLKKKARRIEKCKCSTGNREVVVVTNGEEEEEESKPTSPKENGEVCHNGSSEDLYNNEHEGSCEDEDDGDSVDTPCSCEDLHCTKRKWRQDSWPVYRNGDCGYVGKTNLWVGERDHRNGTTCKGDKSNPCEISRRGEEEEFCSDCLSVSPPRNSNGKKKKKGKRKKGMKEKEKVGI